MYNVYPNKYFVYKVLYIYAALLHKPALDRKMPHNHIQHIR